MIEVTSTTGESFHQVSMYFQKINVDLANCVGFSSDGASNVCGALNSVLSRLRTVSPMFVFVKCTCHSVALCVTYAFKKPPSNLDYLLSEVARWSKCSLEGLNSKKSFK